MKPVNVPKIRFHALRHTCATILVQNGVSPNVVMQLLGHSSVKTTLDLYGHVLPGGQRAAADTLDPIFGTSPKNGGQMVVKSPNFVSYGHLRKLRKSFQNAGLQFVEMGGLEPPTPYMRRMNGAYCGDGIPVTPPEISGKVRLFE